MSELEGHRVLAHCSGFTVEAADGVVGEVETPLFPPDGAVPDFLIVRTSGRARVRRPVLATALVERIDMSRRVIVVRGSEQQIKALPEQLPLAI
jgi:hypothetical protein